jgi:DNA-binding MarR family transcriptional regulator
VPPRTTAPAGELSELAEQLVLASARLVRQARHVGPRGVSVAQARTLAQLRDSGPLRVTDLADRERCAQPSMTAIVTRLADAGLVRREPDPRDGRAVLVAVTDAGREHLRDARRAMAAELATRMRHLDADERACLRRAVGLLDQLSHPEEAGAR